MGGPELHDWLDEHYVMCFRTACLILGNRADAEEAVQDAFLRAWRFRGSLASTASVKPWLYRVVVNASYSKLRKEVPHRNHRADDDAAVEMAGSAVGPEYQAERSELSETVLAALGHLPLSLRVPVVLRYYADLSEREIARAIGRRPGTVKSRLHEARRRLAADPTIRRLTGDEPNDDAGVLGRVTEGRR